MEERVCEVCSQTFSCRADNATYTCSKACASKACWAERRLRGTANWHLDSGGRRVYNNGARAILPEPRFREEP